MKKLIFILLIVLLPVQVWAANTYYVDSNAAGGGDGSIGTPWNSMAPLSGLTFGADDQILSKKDSVLWGNSLNIQQSGTAGHPIIFGSYGTTGAKPIIGESAAVGVSPAWTSDGSGKYHVAYTLGVDDAIMGLTEDAATVGGILQRATGSAMTDGNWYWATNVLYYKPTSSTAASHDVRVQRNSSYLFNLPPGAAYITFQDMTIISPDGIYGATYTEGVSGTIHDITVQRCTFRDSGYRGVDLKFFTNYPVSSITVTNCTFQRQHTSVYFSILGSADNTTYCDGITFTHNTVVNSNEPFTSAVCLDMGDDADGFDAQNVKNSTIAYNDISGHCSLSGISIWATGDFAGINNAIHHNYIHDLANASAMVPSAGGTDTGGDYTAIYSNVIKNCLGNQTGNGGAPWYDGVGGLVLSRKQSSTNHSKVWNNTFIGVHIPIQLRLDSSTGNDADYYDIDNNICYNSDSLHILTTGTISHNTVNYNLYYPNTGTMFYYGSTAYNFANWKTNSGQDANSPTPADPAFVGGSGATAYKIPVTSPAKGTGTTALAGTTDYGSNAWASPPSLGAWEYISAGIKQGLMF